MSAVRIFFGGDFLGSGEGGSLDECLANISRELDAIDAAGAPERAAWKATLERERAALLAEGATLPEDEDFGQQTAPCEACGREWAVTGFTPQICGECAR